jgi:hypothetical protein
VRLGNPHHSKGRQASEVAQVTLQAFEAQGLTQRQMIEELNQLKVPAARGGQWSLMQLQRALKRLGMTTG